mmetsp:Transcript_50814/g.82136  ORF Transcript_50814/g.82136 Transcript_50814/m.82136 type:complete len:145 (-) Transcript_50814:163-597(-)
MDLDKLLHAFTQPSTLQHVHTKRPRPCIRPRAAPTRSCHLDLGALTLAALDGIRADFCKATHIGRRSVTFEDDTFVLRAQQHNVSRWIISPSSTTSRTVSGCTYPGTPSSHHRDRPEPKTMPALVAPNTQSQKRNRLRQTARRT